MNDSIESMVAGIGCTFILYYLSLCIFWIWEKIKAFKKISENYDSLDAFCKEITGKRLNSMIFPHVSSEPILTVFRNKEDEKLFDNGVRRIGEYRVLYVDDKPILVVILATHANQN